jgi:hypothetical protein
MIISEEHEIRAEVTSLEVVWRNSLALVQADLRAKQASNPYYRWAEQATKIRARRANWDANHCWAA